MRSIYLGQLVWHPLYCASACKRGGGLRLVLSVPCNIGIAFWSEILPDR